MGSIKQFLHKVKYKLSIKEIKPIKTPIYCGNLLAGKNALIIGGTGGIGKAIAEAFVENKCKVVITGTNQDRIENIKEALGSQVNGLYFNLLDFKSYERTIAEAIQLLDGHIDILVNSAGQHGPIDFWTICENDYDSVMNVNVKAMFFCSQIVGKHMRDNGIAGHILNISSASALKPGKTPYEISKNAVKSMTLGLADVMIKHGITVNCIGPGPTATQMLNMSSDSPLNWEGNPAGRMATPEEIANWAVFLSSSMGDYIVGDTLYVTGGSGTICIDK